MLPREPGKQGVGITSLRRMFRFAAIIAGVAAAYFITGRLLLVLGAPPNGAVTTVWLPSGISVAALLLFGPVAAIGSFIGSLALDLKNGTPLPGGVLVGIANTGSELLCYFLIIGRSGRALSIVAMRDVLRFVLAALCCSVLSAFVGVSAYVHFGVVPATLYWPIWLTWFGSVVIGIVLITPFLVYSARDWPALGTRARYLEYLAALTTLALAAYLWQGPAFTRNADEPVVLVVILVLLWIAFRFPPAAMTLAVFSLAISSVGGAVLRLGGEPPGGLFVSIFALQLMLGGLAVIGYLLDSMVTDQKRATEALRADIIERRKAEQEVLRLNSELEHQVEQRSRQLLEAQEELVRKEKLAILGQLCGSVGHELRNPLGVMNNAVYFLKLVLGEADETVKEYLGIIGNEIANSQRIIADLLDFARTKAPQKRAVAVRDLIDENLGRCTIAQHLAIQLDIPETLRPLWIDPLQIGQVLTNLISNAVQAMPEGGSLCIGARDADATFGEDPEREEVPGPPTPNPKSPGNFIEISVTDSGEGISPENMKKLFQPLFTTKAKGVGLGLVVCRNLIEANGGWIGVASEPGKGTCFAVRLPAVAGEP